MLQRIWAGVVVALIVAAPAAAITTKSLNDGLTAEEVITTLTGPGAQISNIKITGSPLQIGKFEGGEAIGIASGIILSSGSVADAVGPNNASGKGQSLGGSSYDDLDTIVAPRTTRDAVVLEFDVVTFSTELSIKYVFASEEYLEYVNSAYNDVFAFFVGGANIALVPGSKDPVTINSINLSKNASIFHDNTQGNVDIQYDGYTAVLTAVTSVTPGVPTHLRIALADVSDGILDSAVMIAQGGISGASQPPIAIADVPWVVTPYDTAVDVPLSVYYATVEDEVDLSVFGMDYATATFTPLYLSEDNHVKSNMALTVGSQTLPGSYVLTIRSATEMAEAFSTLEVVVDCQPPFILGTGQPVSKMVNFGQSATLTLVPEGSAPYTIQWYSGYPGMTFNPVAGATGASLVTGAVTEIKSYWARITNPCGSFDSTVAFAIPQ